MKILLIGEYSGVHSNLRQVLLEKKHEVLFIHDGDSYKKFSDNDFSIEYSILKFKNDFINKILILYILFLDLIGLKGIIQCIRYLKILDGLGRFDVVQLINTKPFGQFGSFANYLLLRRIFKINRNCYLSALGDDYTWVKSCLLKKPPYSMFNNMKISNIKYFIYSLNYVYGIGSKFIDRYVRNNVVAIIPGLFDYYYAYKSMGIPCTEIVPIPIAVSESVNNLKIQYPIKIFHGWQSGKELRKGNDLFDEAIEMLLIKYPDKIEYKIVSNVPYSEYIKLFDDCHIFIDQCYSLDRGVNALLGMSKGKVVLSGCEELTINYYKNNISKSLINATPNIQELYCQIEDLILNIDKLNEIMKKSKKFIEDHHNYEEVYNLYLKIWFNR